jgi:hypothetical protein
MKAGKKSSDDKLSSSDLQMLMHYMKLQQPAPVGGTDVKVVLNIGNGPSMVISVPINEMYTTSIVV